MEYNGDNKRAGARGLRPQRSVLTATRRIYAIILKAMPGDFKASLREKNGGFDPVTPSAYPTRGFRSPNGKGEEKETTVRKQPSRTNPSRQAKSCGQTWLLVRRREGKAPPTHKRAGIQHCRPNNMATGAGIDHGSGWGGTPPDYS